MQYDEHVLGAFDLVCMQGAGCWEVVRNPPISNCQWSEKEKINKERRELAPGKGKSWYRLRQCKRANHCHARNAEGSLAHTEVGDRGRFPIIQGFLSYSKTFLLYLKSNWNSSNGLKQCNPWFEKRTPLQGFLNLLYFRITSRTSLNGLLGHSPVQFLISRFGWENPISYKSPGFADAVAAGLGTTLSEPLVDCTVIQLNGSKVSVRCTTEKARSAVYTQGDRQWTWGGRKKSTDYLEYLGGINGTRWGWM